MQSLNSENTSFFLAIPLLIRGSFPLENLEFTLQELFPVNYAC